MPTDLQTMQLDENEVIAILNEIGRLINSSSYHDVLIGDILITITQEHLDSVE